MRPGVPVLVLLAACGVRSDADVADTDATAVGVPRERVLLVRAIAIPQADDTGHMVGFDLDGAATAAGDASGCGVPDDLDARGRPVVDAALNALFTSPAIQATEAVGVGDVLQVAVNQGDLLLALRLTDLDDTADDDAVHVELVRAQGVPVVGADGRITADQTFDVHPDFPPVEIGVFPLVGGTLVARPFDLHLPLAILGTPIEIELLDAAVRVTLADDGTFEGALGGGVATSEVLRLVTETPNINPAVGQALSTAMGFWADLDADGDGTCERISLALALGGVPAFLFDATPTDTATPTAP